MTHQHGWIKTRFLTAFIIGSLSINASAQQKQVFKISPAIVTEGDKIQITYDPSVNGIKESIQVKASVYLFKDYKWQGYDLPMVKSDTGWTTAYLIPKGAAMLACRFLIGDSIDRGGKFPFATVINTAKKATVPGARTEWGMLRSKDASSQMSPLVAKESLIEPRVLVSLWIAREYGDMSVRRNMFFDIARGINTYLPQKADSILRKGGAEITALKDVTEKELITVEKVYRTVLRNNNLADSMKRVILAAYPNGLMSRLQSIYTIYSEQDKVKKLTLWEDFIKAAPFDQYSYEDYLSPALGERSFFANSLIGAANVSFQDHQFDKVIALTKNGPFDLLDYFYDHYVDYPFRVATPPITDKEALTLSQAFTKILLERINTASLLDRGIFAPSEWKRMQMMDDARIWAYHIGLLYKAGQYDAALKFGDIVKPYLGHKFISFNTAYVKVLDHFHKVADAKAYITAAIKENTASPEMIETFKAYYIKSNGSAKGFDNLYASLRPGDTLAEKHTRLKASMVNVPAINFNLQNIPGQRFELDKLKGKIVVLDFWASWCFPCKAAMPGMQTLVNKYQGDDVDFFFIATAEESPNYKKLINDFLAAKKYNFNVLYDEENPKTKGLDLTFSNYAGLLKLSGIPQKIIIDQNGMIRWVAGGFNGDLIELTDEVSYIVDLLKNEKSK